MAWWGAAVLGMVLAGCGAGGPGGGAAQPLDAHPAVHSPGVAPQTGSGSSASAAPPPRADLTMAELKNMKNLWIDCDLSRQRVYIKDGDRVLREMVTSSGLDTSPDNTTPRGTFYILPYRDTWFYNPQIKEGAMYWVAFQGLEFLFHSVPMDENHRIIESEAKKLGQKASHGCLRLSMEDAKWFYENIPVGTKVVIHD
ncbi:MAG: L,D-transpeptidase [Alicyclobacillaceae bacterium]|nr:L,D-transpeptidase [Alicyclobacillaceae bacterium]